MRNILLTGVCCLTAVGRLHGAAEAPILFRSDVIFMYQATPEIYREYGATVLAWGGTPSQKSLADAEGVKFFGSVGMVTEFSRYYERFPETYEQGLCRGLEGKPFKVPWLTDHQHKGIPYWWCCTRQPQFRTYISERVQNTVKAGAYGVHIDDHLGTAGALFLDGCFCDLCAAGFRSELQREPAPGVTNAAFFDYPQVLREWLAVAPGRKIHQHPLWQRWRAYQLRGAAEFMAELRALAARVAGRTVPMSANAGLLWGPHLNDYETLDFFSAEIDHHAPSRKLSETPVVAYRIADAVNRPLASTASGQDWAFIKEHNLPGLVRGWIALGYASGHSLMAPHRQWCYTSEKGTHWYEGPKEKFAPLYRFVRANRDLFDGFTNVWDLAIAYPQRAFDRNPGEFIRTCERLTQNHLSYQLLLGGDEVVRHPLPVEAVKTAKPLFVYKQSDFTGADQTTLAQAPPPNRVADVDAAIQAVKPTVQPLQDAPLRAFARAKPGAVVVHLLNWHYDSAEDDVKPVRNAIIKLQLEKLGRPDAPAVTVHAPGRAPGKAEIVNGAVTIPEAGLWTILELN
jgi:hypothetical protein